MALWWPPLNALDRKVQDWRRTGTFDGSNIAAAPLEVRALSASFHQAALSLAEQARRLDEAAEKQALLMREIHHRVKNNLQIVASLLNLQAARIRLPEARAEFAAARDRVRALADAAPAPLFARRADQHRDEQFF